MLPQSIWIRILVFCGIYLCEVKPLGQTWTMLLAPIITLPSPLFLNNTPNNWSWGVLFPTRIKGFLGGVYHAWFIVYISDPVLFFLLQHKTSCGHGLLIVLIFWPTSPSPFIIKIPLAFITVDGGESCSSIYVWWYLDFVAWPHSPYTWIYICFCLYQHWIDIIIVMINIGWTDGVLWLNWTRQD